VECENKTGTVEISKEFLAGYAYVLSLEFTDHIGLVGCTLSDWGGESVGYLLEADETEINLPYAETSGNTLTIKTNAPRLSLDPDAPDWILNPLLSVDATADADGFTRYTLTFGTTKNIAAQRTGYIRVSAGELDLELVVTVKQAEGLYLDRIGEENINLAKEAGTGQGFDVGTNASEPPILKYSIDGDLTHATSTAPNWFTPGSATRSDYDKNGTTDNQYTYAYTYWGNYSPAARVVYVHVLIDGDESTAVRFKVQQAGGLPEENPELANCYRVSPGSSVNIPITRAITVGGLYPSADATVEVLWEDEDPDDADNPGVISGTPVLSGSGAARTIAVTTTGNEGNAVVALRGSDGLIYWSWHIWVTDDPTLNAWINTSSPTYIFLDRNRGATEATLSIASRGLFYQWGRKDPFPGGPGAAGSAALGKFYGIDQAGAGSRTTEYTTNMSEDATGISAGLLESVRKPTTFFSRIYIVMDWLPMYELTLWKTTSGLKTVFDPCPKGWRVPVYKGDTQSEAGMAVNSPWYGCDNNSDNNSDWIADSGHVFDTYAQYPVTGSRDIDGGALYSGGTYSYVWSATRWGRYSQGMGFRKTFILVCSEDLPSTGNSVRCVKENP
jgi:hypothetical protein